MRQGLYVIEDDKALTIAYMNGVKRLHAAVHSDQPEKSVRSRDSRNAAEMYEDTSRLPDEIWRTLDEVYAAQQAMEQLRTILVERIRSVLKGTGMP